MVGTNVRIAVSPAGDVAAAAAAGAEAAVAADVRWISGAPKEAMPRFASSTTHHSEGALALELAKDDNNRCMKPTKGSKSELDS